VPARRDRNDRSAGRRQSHLLGIAGVQVDGGLLGVASRLPVPDWLPAVDLDTGDPEQVRSAAPRRAVVAVTPGWHRLRGPADLARLDQNLEGWDTTRALLSA